MSVMSNQPVRSLLSISLATIALNSEQGSTSRVTEMAYSNLSILDKCLGFGLSVELFEGKIGKALFNLIMYNIEIESITTTCLAMLSLFHTVPLFGKEQQ